MKFFSLFKKELKEMLTVQTLMTMVITVLVMIFAGNAMSGAIDNAEEESSSIIICDKDQTVFTKSVLNYLENPTGGEKNNVTYVEIEGDDYVKELERLNIKNVVIIPEGFADSINAGEQAEIEYISRMTSLATLSNISTGSSTAMSLISGAVKSAIYTDKVSSGALNENDVALIENPVTINETTVVGNKSDNISSTLVYAAVQMQGMFVPIMVFILVIYASQMILNAVATEKIDKTLETLLSAPISRLAVLSSKMLSAGTVAGLNAVVYMVGMNQMTKAATSMTTDAVSGLDATLQNLGLTLTAGDYVLVGLQMFLTILISLSVSLVLGVLAKDVKSAQTFVMPIMLLAMIPYMLSMFVDISTLSPVLKYLVYAIPFTHTFTASQNIMFGTMDVYWIGLVYQIIILIICMAFALKVFMSDRIFTMSLSFGNGKKKKRRKA